jgi:hypothetical protein
MKLTRAASITALILIYALAAQAQDSKQTTKPQSKGAGRVNVSYDRFKDETNVGINYMTVKGASVGEVMLGGDYQLELRASYTYPGRTPVTPKRVVLHFFSSSKDWLYLKDYQRELNVLADGERLPLGTMERVNSHVGGSYVSESLALALPPDTFAKIARAKVVEMRLGHTTFKLKDKHLDALRALADSIPPAAPAGAVNSFISFMPADATAEQAQNGRD